MSNIELKPAIVFDEFAKINQIPRPSKREEKMIAYLKEWGASHGLETKVDETGNVIIRKGATKGMENRKTVILQSHMDMVCDKLVDYEIDFDNDPIKTYIDGEWLTAEVRRWVPTTVSAVRWSWRCWLRTISSTVPSSVSLRVTKKRA